MCCYRRKESKRKKKLLDTEREYKLENMTSIREHIRSADSTINPLMELLASSKPGELIQYPVDCIEYVKELGEGQFGKVFQGMIQWAFPKKIVPLPPVEDINFFEVDPPWISSQFHHHPLESSTFLL